MRTVRKGDQVKVISGNDRGKEGEVLQVVPGRDRVLVRGVNIQKRHQRPSARQREGGIIEREGLLHISNVMVVCPECDEPARVGFKRNDDGEKMRLCRSCGEEFE
jgi:large subunit ribosomal protein L24